MTFAWELSQAMPSLIIALAIMLPLWIDSRREKPVPEKPEEAAYTIKIYKKEDSS